jgi:hypothetical protein
MRMRLFTSAEDRRLEVAALVESGNFSAWPPHCRLRTLGLADLDVLLHRLQLLGAGQRAHLRVGHQLVADLDVADAPFEALRKSS